MQLDNAAIEDFQKLYLAEYGIKLTKQEAIELGMRLIQFVKAVYGKNLPDKKVEISKGKRDNPNVLT